MLLRVLSDAVQPQLSKAIGGSRVGPFLLVAVCQKAATLVQLVLAARAKLLAGRRAPEPIPLRQVSDV